MPLQYTVSLGFTTLSAIFFYCDNHFTILAVATFFMSVYDYGMDAKDYMITQAASRGEAILRSTLDRYLRGDVSPRLPRARILSEITGAPVDVWLDPGMRDARRLFVQAAWESTRRTEDENNG